MGVGGRRARSQLLRPLEAPVVLNAFLRRATTAVRAVYHGQLTYASLIWEAVDWSQPYTRGRHGATYPDMPWEPKAGFGAVAEFYNGVESK